MYGQVKNVIDTFISAILFLIPNELFGFSPIISGVAKLNNIRDL